MVSGKTIFSIIALQLCLSAHLVADDWPGPLIREVFSPDRQYFVRITPGESWGETYGFKGAKIGKHAEAAFFREQADKGYRLERTIDLPNPLIRTRRRSTWDIRSPLTTAISSSTWEMAQCVSARILQNTAAGHRER